MTSQSTSVLAVLCVAAPAAAQEPDRALLDRVVALLEAGSAEAAAAVASPGDPRGVAVLRYWGTTRVVSRGTIFEQAQIARAVELGLGVEGPEQIELITDDVQSAAHAQEIRQILDQG